MARIKVDRGNEWKVWEGRDEQVETTNHAARSEATTSQAGGWENKARVGGRS